MEAIDDRFAEFAGRPTRHHTAWGHRAIHRFLASDLPLPLGAERCWEQLLESS